MRSCLVFALLAAVACDNASGPGITLDVTPDSLELVRNTTAHLSVNALDANGNLVTGVAVSFASDDTTIATVDNLGIVRARTLVGETRVRVRGGGAMTVVPVRVTGIPTAVIVTPLDTVIRTTATLQYQAVVLDEFADTIPNVAVTWGSSDSSIATITSSGLGSARSKAGTTTITAGYGGHGGYGTLRVAIPGVATRVRITPSDTAISSGVSVQLTATVTDGLGDPVASTPILWLSQDPTIASVSSTGLVHSEGPTGTATIRASHDTLSGTARVTVLDSLLVGRTSVAGSAYAAAISNGVAYVGLTDQSRIVRANLPSHTFSSSVPVGSTPTEITFNSTGSRAYVTNQYSSTVSVISVATNSQIDVIPVGSRPFEVIVAPGDSILYVGKVDSVYGISLASKAIIVRFPIPGVGNGVAIAKDTLLYVSTHTGGTVVEFNLRTRTLGRTFAVGGVPQKLAVSPDGSELFIANEAGYVQFWNLLTGFQIGSNLILPSAAYGLARRATNGFLYVTGAYFGGGYIYVVDPVGRTLIHSTVVGGSTRHIVFTADGTIGIVPNEAGWVDFLR